MLRRVAFPNVEGPLAREDSTLSVGLEVLPGFQAAVGRGRQDAAGLCAAEIRGRFGDTRLN